MVADLSIIRCRQSKKMFQCPNGDDSDMERFPGYIEYNGCKIEEW